MAGAVDKVAFAEGATVTQGQVLVVIDSERYDVAVGQAKAALARAQASEKAAEAELARRQGAVSEHPGLIPGTEIATFETSVATSKADVESATQSLRTASINLRDAFVRAPFAGVVQSRTVQAGQYLQAGTVLATLLQRDPLLLRFPVSEQDAPRIKPGMIANLTLRESARAYTAKIMLVAAAADPTTRLVPVTAEVDDTEHKYWLRPGAHCDVNVPVGALGLGPGSETRGPMADAVIGGLVLSTALSLVVVPAFYVVADRLRSPRAVPANAPEAATP